MTQIRVRARIMASCQIGTTPSPTSRARRNVSSIWPHSISTIILSGTTRSANAPATRPTKRPGISEATSTTPSMNSDWVWSKTSQRTAAAWSQVPTRLIPCPM